MFLMRYVWKVTSVAQRQRVKYFLLVASIISLVYALSTMSVIPRSVLKLANTSNRSIWNDFTSLAKTISLGKNISLVENVSLSGNDTQLAILDATLTTQILTKPVPTRPYKDRFKFVLEKKGLSLNGPILNSIPSKVTWREDLKHVEICNLTYPFILAVVTSAVANRDKRDTVRQSWANPKIYRHTGIRAVFALGATTNETLQEAVDREVTQHSDIIQNNFIDSYRNLTYKTMASLTWIQGHCPQVPFIVKIDDDVIVNPFHLKKYLENELKKPMDNKIKADGGEDLGSVQRPELRHPATNYIYGKLETHPPPHRNDKWKVSMEEYPEGRYPPFVLGPAYILGGNIAGRLLKYAPYTPFLWLEDVYTTGLVACAAQIKHVQVDTLLFCVRTFSSALFTGKKCFWMEHNQKDRNRIWQKILSSSGIKF